MEFIAIEAFRTAMQNPAFADSMNRRSSSNEVSFSDSHGLPPSGNKIGNLLRRLSLSRSTSSSATATPVASPRVSQPNSRNPSPSRRSAPVIAIPVMTVVDSWPASPIPPAIYYPPLPSIDNISSSPHTEMLSTCDSPIHPLHENDDHNNNDEHTTHIEQRMYL